MAKASVFNLLALGTVAAVGLGAAFPIPAYDGYVVTKVIDGDTIEIEVDGGKKRVRLLNIDTPEMLGDELETCLAKEAKAFTESLLPPGTLISLEEDIEKFDNYGRLLAGVTIEESINAEHVGTFINTEVARNGFALAIKIEPNTKFYPAVAEAVAYADEHQLGIYDPTVSCSLTAQLDGLESEGISLHTVQVGDLTDDALDLHLGSISALYVVYENLKDQSFQRGSEGRFHEFHRSKVPRDQWENIDAIFDEVTTSTGAEIERRAERARLEEERLEREAEQRRLEEVARAEREAQAAREAEAERESSHNQNQPSQPKQAAPPPPNQSLYSGAYNGCRAYGGNYVPNAIDNVGRVYTRIDCTTKLPIR